MLATSQVFSSLSLPPIVSSTSSHVLNVVTNVRNIKNDFDVNHHRQSISHPSWRQLKLKWYIQCQLPSWSSPLRCSCPPWCCRPKKTWLQCIALQCCTHVESKENFHVNHNHYSISYIRVEENSIQSDHPNLSDLPGLLLLVVLAVQSDDDHQTRWPKSRQVGYLWKGLLMNIKGL